MKLDSAWQLCIVTTTNCMIITSMYTLAPYAILEMGATSDKQAIGFWSGFLISSFFIVRALTLPCWGKLADRVNKATIVCSSLGLTGFGMLCCAFCSSLQSLSILRMFTGACSAVHSTSCALAFQLEGNHAVAIVESGFSLGRLVGPGLASMCLWFALPASLDQFPVFWSCFLMGALQFLVLPLVPWPVKPKDVIAPMLDAVVESPILDTDELEENRKAARQAQFLSAGMVTISVAMEEACVLFAVGTLGISPKYIGAMYLLAGSVDLILQNLFLIPLIKDANTLSLQLLRKRALMLYSFPLFMLPCIPADFASVQVRIAILGLLCAARNAIAYLFFVTNMALLNNASPGRVASAQSMRMAIGSFFQVVGPPLGATSYAWCATSDWVFPFDHSAPFLVAALATLACTLFS